MTVAVPVPDRSEAARAAARQLADFGDFAAILRRHIGEVTDSTEKAGFDILSRLIEIEGAILAMVDFVQDSVQSGPVAEAVEQTLESMCASEAVVRRMQEDQARSAEVALARMAEMKTRTEGLDDMVEAIRRIAKATYFLSINAGIEATRAGQSAGGFAVVAREVRDLSKQVEDVSKKIGDGVAQLAEGAVSAMAEVVQDQQTRGAANLAELSQTFETVGQRVASVLTHQKTLMAHVQGQGQALVGPINQLAASIQFQDITRQQLGHVGHSLEDLASHYGACATAIERGMPLPPGQVVDFIDRMFEGYVMAQQRNAHRGAPEEHEPPSIQLF